MLIHRLTLIAAAVALTAVVVPVARLHAQATPESTSASTAAPTTTARPVTGTPTARGSSGAVGGTSGRGGRGTAVSGASGGGGFVGGSFGGGGVTGGIDRGASGRSMPTPSLGEGPTCPFDATIYEVLLPVDQIGRMDLDALTRAATTAATFEKALADLGSSRPLYRADQSVRLSGDSITVGTQMPYITNSQITNTGQAINSVSYTQVGAIFKITGKTSTPTAIELDLGIQMSTMSEGTAISDKVKAPMFRNTTLSYKGPVAARQPFVVISADAASVESSGKAVAYIARVTLGPGVESK
jgi:hypothetical protein